MFKKPFKIKSNNQVKGSERKNIRDLFVKSFPNLTEVDANDLFNKKEVLNSIRIVTHDDEVVQVYSIQKRPMFFEVRGKILPTIFLLWKFPYLVYAFTTHPNVLTFITSGADLMLPGVVTPSSQSGLPKYGSVTENEVVCVNLSNNVAAIAIGLACQSSASMIQANGRGKCVTINHFYGDKLCTLEGMNCLPVPNMVAPKWLTFKSYDEDFPELGAEPKKMITEEVAEEKENTDGNIPETKNVEEIKHVEENTNEEESGEDMDELIWYCFLGAIKYSKTLTLPILISNFYKLQMLPVCPPGKTLDIKKSSFKKLKPFLDEMCKLGLITVKEIKKGVEAITGISKDHPKLSEFYIDPKNRPAKRSDQSGALKETNVVESYIITQNVLPIFQEEGYRKGDTVQVSDIRKCVTKYVKDNNLQDEVNMKFVKPKDLLRTVCKTQNSITWEELIEKVCESMKNCFKVSSGADEVVNKGKVSPITISVAVRSGNKKVTLVDNLELFGINISEFAKECQHGVAASTSVTPKPPGKKSDQLLVQGNQVIFVYNLLTDKYKINKKYVRGLENAPKKKK